MQDFFRIFVLTNRRILMEIHASQAILVHALKNT